MQEQFLRLLFYLLLDFFLEDHEKNAHKLQKFITTQYVDSVIKHLPATKD